VVGITCAYFYQGDGWYQNTRFDLVRAILEKHTLRIDAYAANTGDRSFHEGHTYLPTAPGHPLATVPFIALARPIVALGVDATSDRGVRVLTYLGSVATGALPTVLAVLLILWCAQALGASPGGAAFAAAVYGLGCPAWVYATFFWGHALSAFCLIAGFAAALALREARSPRSDLLLGAAVGFGGGWATFTEYPAVAAAAILSMLALVHTWPRGRGAMARAAAGILVGAGVCVVALLLYQRAAFGSFWHNSYASMVGQGGMKEGIIGVTYPKTEAIRGLLIGRFRGLLPLAPVLAASPLGFALLVTVPRARAASVAAVLVFLFYLLFYASFVYWHGGWCFGPRYLGSALPFLCLPLAIVWDRAPKLLKPILGIVALAGVALALLGASTDALTNVAIRDPVVDVYWPAFRRGQMMLTSRTTGAWNLGQLVGLKGLASLAPLVAVWIGAAVLWLRGLRDRVR